MARKILLADDSVTAQNMGRKILADAGYEVLTVNNGSAALKKIAEHKPDLVVLDVYMPGYSGLEVCSRLKESPETARMPVLLTVGKLEPFKPEEARRVQADGFIVKPFEASELLSALAKLEDKIVPRSEPAKSGRLARAVASIEEAGRDKNAGGEDAGWKNRIAFPAKKEKEKKGQEEQDDSAIYNPMNRDLRTVIDSDSRSAKSTADETLAREKEVAASAQAEGPKGGFTKDVTPEEIAAFAAAAAKAEASLGIKKNADAIEVRVTAEEKIEANAEAVKEVAPGVAAHADAAMAMETPAAATFAESKVLDRGTEDQPIATNASLVHEPVATASHADVMAVIAALEPANGESWTAGNSGNGSGPASQDQSSPAQASVSTHSASLSENLSTESSSIQSLSAPVDSPDQKADIPVTMAAAAGLGSVSGPRWAAISVAVDAEEAATSLEHEMQKAYAAFAAAEVAYTEYVAVPPVVEIPARPFQIVSSSMSIIEAQNQPEAEMEKSNRQEESVPTASEVSGTYPSVGEESIVSQELSAGKESSVSAEAATAVAALTEASVVPKTELIETEPQKTDSRASDLQKIESHTFEPQTIPSFENESQTGSRFDSQPEMNAAIATEPRPASEIAITAQEKSVSATLDPETISSHPQTEELMHRAEPVAGPVMESPKQGVARTHLHEVRFEGQPYSGVSAERSVSEPGGTEDMAAKRESELSASTAAAWANWRQIRETAQPAAGTPESQKSDSKEQPSSSFEPVAAPAAMAVAAGAERAPEEASSAAPAVDAGVLASMVDTMLAELRPKLVEEISRKLAAEKK